MARAMATRTLLLLLLVGLPATLVAGRTSGRSAVELRPEWAAGAAPQEPFTFVPGGPFAPLRLVATGAPTAPVSPTPEARDAAVVATLWNGDRAVGEVVGGEGDDVVLALAGGGRLALPLDVLRSIEYPARREQAGAEQLVAPADGDRLYRRAGSGVDLVDGTFDGVSAEGLSFESRLGLRVFPFDEIVALFVEPLDPPEPLRGTAGAVVVDLVGGSRLSGRLADLGAEALTLELPWERSVVLSTASVALVSADDERLAYLGGLAPDSVSGGSAFGDDLGLVFAPLADRAVHGAELRCGGRVWPRGLGVQAPTSVGFDLSGRGFTRLFGRVGIDDSTAVLEARGAAVFAVLGDGSELWRSDVIRGGQAPVEFPALDVSGVERLELIVEMGPDLNLGDRANWLDVLLVR
jgi:hypothetical protein